MMKTIAAYTLSTLASASFAHEGHGLGASHWHATDAAGFVAMVALIAVAMWRSRGGK